MNARGKAEQGLEGGHRGPPPVEAEGELIQVGLEVIMPDAVVGTAEPGLKVPEDPSRGCPAGERRGVITMDRSA